ncbi:hypothetical protein ACFWGN_20760 [Oerskovia sp. NPDC060338]|uniref:hypothetical protein n=1 Tax=Oerskovia sp. NPDC060338 TaxID=3347100 RepID=UPI003664EF7C
MTTSIAAASRAAESAARALAAYVHAVETGRDIASHYEAAVAAAHTWKSSTEGPVANAAEVAAGPLFVVRDITCPTCSFPETRSSIVGLGGQGPDRTECRRCGWSTHARVTRPKVAIAPVDPTGTKGLLYRASCEHCVWTADPTAKSHLQQVEAPLHRQAHRDGRAPVCHVVVGLTESADDWTWACGCGASTDSGWHGFPFEFSAADAALDAVEHGHQGDIDVAADLRHAAREQIALRTGRGVR